MLLTAVLARFRPRRLAVFALAGALAYNLTPYLMLIPYRTDARPAKQAFWQPAIDFLKAHSGAGYRVEVVPTAAHWESYWLPRAGYPIARGWYRQLDVVDNRLLYRHSLAAASYRRWLRAMAVKYVVLPATRLDPAGGPAEARLLRSGAAGLTIAFQGHDSTIYELPAATPLLTGPARAEITRLDHATIAGQAGAAGRYLLRERYTPYLRLSPSGCVARAPGDMTWLVLPAAGSFTLQVPHSASKLLHLATDDDSEVLRNRYSRRLTTPLAPRVLRSIPWRTLVALAAAARRRCAPRLPRPRLAGGRPRTGQRRVDLGAGSGRSQPGVGNRPWTGLENGRRPGDRPATPAHTSTSSRPSSSASSSTASFPAAPARSPESAC